ncbi:peptidoglycan-binding protein [Tardiphaga alba]|uniref:Peptidoglycan-binding protein n=1 Tax=Tardiphaga alba TaxID=340268 RepID=A0ABX8A365_9BRAD|nr:serine protease [Tardiphaga alba]QUS37712.1 peptidoglycan-binding protein [Tardiphaga alba]
MRSMLSATAMIMLASAAYAQTPAPTPAKPKPVATVPVRPAMQTPADTAKDMTQTERLTIQSDLAWSGHYNGAINGEVSERMVNAIKAFQKDNGGKQTGVLNPQERGVLAATAKKPRDNVGWKIVTDMVTGAKLGIPGKLVPQQISDANGSKWQSSTGTIQILLTRRKEEAPSTAKLAEAERKQPGRKLDYSAVKPDFFVLSGLQNQKKFYIRGQLKGDEVRMLTILYDQATEGTMEPVVIAMSSAFDAFPAGVQAMGPPPRKKVEYASGIVVSADGAIVTDRQAVDGCLSITVAGHGNADKVAEDKARDLALLRIYGARDLKPLALGTGTAKPDLTLVGIADPQNQAGGSAVSTVRAATAQGAGSETTLSPAPGIGFAGAAAIDGDGAFAGVTQLKPVVVAGPTPAATQAVLASADAVRNFVKANGVATEAGKTSDAKASMVRLICVRK